MNYLNQLRLDNLLSALHRQDMNLEGALASVDEAIRKIDLEVVAANRGPRTVMPAPRPGVDRAWRSSE